MQYGPYNSKYGYSDDKRLTVCKDALRLGIKSAALKHKVGVSSVYCWLKAYSQPAIQSANSAQ